LDLLHRAWQRLGGHPQALHLGTAGRAALHVVLEGLRLQLVERAQQVRAHVVLVALVIVHGAHAASVASARRILSSPRRIRPFTVPTGMSSISAICVCVKPPK